MSITPQAIKDQEFQSKFRGYDTIEVKAYLELLAEEFFELLEDGRKREDDNDALVEERDGLTHQNESYAQEITEIKKELEKTKQDFSNQEVKTQESVAEAEELQTVIADHEQEKKDLEDEVSEAEARIKNTESLLADEKREKDNLLNKLQLLEEQNSDLKKEEIEFKSTLGAVQKFSREVKEQSEAEAKSLMEKAEDDVNSFRQAASMELARIPQEIEELYKERKQVRDDLKEILQTYLRALDSFAVVEESEKGDEMDELFQKIDISEDGVISSDDLDKIDMDLDLPISLLEEDGDAEKNNF